jgi:hypothetical protein
MMRFRAGNVALLNGRNQAKNFGGNGMSTILAMISISFYQKSWLCARGVEGETIDGALRGQSTPHLIFEPRGFLVDFEQYQPPCLLQIQPC